MAYIDPCLLYYVGNIAYVGNIVYENYSFMVFISNHGSCLLYYVFYVH
jgi:hypothetical protein